MYTFAKSTLAIEEMPRVKVKADKATTKYLTEVLFKNSMIIVIMGNLKWPHKVLKCYLFLMFSLLLIINIGTVIIY